MFRPRRRVPISVDFGMGDSVWLRWVRTSWGRVGAIRVDDDDEGRTMLTRFGKCTEVIGNGRRGLADKWTSSVRAAPISAVFEDKPPDRFERQIVPA